MGLSTWSILGIAVSLLLLGVNSPARAAIECRDCIYDADGDGANETDDDLLDICLSESSPTWSATCEAYDLNGDGFIDLQDLALWFDECGDDVVCEGGCQDCIYDADGDGFNEEQEDLIDICLDESSPTWSATCEAYDFNGNGAVDLPDLATWDNDCGSQPILCEDISPPPIPAVSTTGLVIFGLMLTTLMAWQIHRRSFSRG